MAKKAAAPKAGKAALAKVTKKEKMITKAKPPVGSSLIVQDEHCDSLERMYRGLPSLAPETLDQKVKRCIRDNFKGWSYLRTDHNFKNGGNLRQRIRKYKEASQDGDKSVQFGKFYFAELRTIYGCTSDPEKMIDVVDETVIADPR